MSADIDRLAELTNRRERRVRLTRSYLVRLYQAVDDLRSELASVREDNTALRELVQRRDEGADQE